VTSVTARSSTKVAHRFISPYEATEDFRDVFESTHLILGDDQYFKGGTAVIPRDQLVDNFSLSLSLDLEALESQAARQGIDLVALSFVLLTEVPFVGLLDVNEMSIPALKELIAERNGEVEFPQWARDALGRGRLELRAYLVVNADLKADGQMPLVKGSALASWACSVLPEQDELWFQPQLLSESVRETLQERTGVSVPKSTMVFVDAEGVADNVDVSQGVKVYINPEIAAFLNESRHDDAAKLVEAQIIFHVLDRMFAAIRCELDEIRQAPSLEGTPAQTVLELIAKSADCTVVDVLETMARGALDEEALRCQLQKEAKLVPLSRSALRGDE